MNCVTSERIVTAARAKRQPSELKTPRRSERDVLTSWPHESPSGLNEMETRPLLIGGEWRTTADAREVRSPYSSELVARFSVASRGEVEESIDAAQRASVEMRELPRHAVANSLRAIADGIRSRAEEFARTIALEAGKPIKTARAEVERGVMTFVHASEEARRFAGEVVPLDGQSIGA